MNERHMKIMVPYQEPMDICPDCSEHPCDCGLPAGYKADIRFAANFAPHIKVIEATKVAEIIEQRDELLRYNEAFRQETLICSDCDAISKEEYDRAIEQRDRLAEALDRIARPIWWMQEDQKRATGSINGINGAMAVSLSESANYLKGIATEALQSLKQPTEL